MEIIKLGKAKTEKIVKVLEGGGLVVAPSDTVYGLLVDSTNQRAVKKLIQFKNRPPGKPISVFVADLQMLKENVTVNQGQHVVLNQLLPGPFTVILNAKQNRRMTPPISNQLLSEKKTLGIRIPDFEFIQTLINTYGKPVTATSANLSGRSAHYSVDSLLKALPESKKKLIDLIVDAGKLPRNKPSTIVDLTTSQLKIVRHGDIVFKDSNTYISDSPSQTKKIAQFVLRKMLGKSSNTSLQKPLIFIIEGNLGAGKTIFVRGLAEVLGVVGIISPTYVVFYEYQIKSAQGRNYLNMLIHIDLYNIIDPEEFKYLHLEKYLTKGNILTIEWGEKSGEILDQMKKAGQVVFVRMSYLDEKKREIKIHY